MSLGILSSSLVIPGGTLAPGWMRGHRDWISGVMNIHQPEPASASVYLAGRGPGFQVHLDSWSRRAAPGTCCCTCFSHTCPAAAPTHLSRLRVASTAPWRHPLFLLLQSHLPGQLLRSTPLGNSLASSPERSGGLQQKSPAWP